MSPYAIPSDSRRPPVHSATGQYSAVSEPLVNIRATLARAVAEHVIAAEAAAIVAARAKDTLTLWHLLSRVANEGDRLRIFERMVSFVSLPAGISRERVLALDKDALRRWREELAWTW